MALTLNPGAMGEDPDELLLMDLNNIRLPGRHPRRVPEMPAAAAATRPDDAS